ncbi:Membrane-associated enzyme, PAP2 (acid phosphatase) superfamily [Rhizobium sp. RU20A]|uniref:phosphatase PAP2 family protein n=1 Tax=Rhizobium sp. RU20A TaxID=1907412 RepID=UPI0009539C9E|nr:phosphatase PAP2 family protein [Rhizobium sp. RU20A]SIQ36575.1 Membrane-associated enzyme, PAP2 (acid phosphatase) superfamily [Rhizobium sp. RU20A]
MTFQTPTFGPHRNPRATMATPTPILTCLAVTTCLSLLFIALPSLDRTVTSLFFVAGLGFPARSVHMLQQLRAVGQYVPMAFAIAMVLGTIMKIAYPSRPSLFPPRFMVFFASLYLLGPGLIINCILKPFWDRPRPIDTIDFGGRFTFVDAWSMGETIFSNRSFASGEAAAVVCLLPLALFVHPAWRRSVTTLLVTFAIAVSANRIVFGAHFLSDVLIASALMATLTAILWHAFFGRNAPTDEDVDQALSAIGFGIAARVKAVGRRLWNLAGMIRGVRA